MAKYTFEDKLKMVLDYLDGNQGYETIAKKYGMKSCTLLKNWVFNYKAYGADGLKPRKTKSNHTLDFKLTVLNFIQETGSSYRDTAHHFKLHNPSMIAKWKRSYLKEGIEGLKKPIGRPSKMTKKKKIKPFKKRSITPSEVDRIQALEAENDYLRTEVAFLKKLRELQEEEDQTKNYSELSED